MGRSLGHYPAINQGDEGGSHGRSGAVRLPGQRPWQATTAPLPKLIVRVRFSSPAPSKSPPVSEAIG
jgi:hypothetical protein